MVVVCLQLNWALGGLIVALRFWRFRSFVGAIVIVLATPKAEPASPLAWLPSPTVVLETP